jgi:hypothetical protein
MDLLGFQIIIRIYLNSRRPIGLSTVSIPDRDFVNLQAFIGSYYSLQVWAGRQKRLSKTSEVSIPGRDLSLPIDLEVNLLFIVKHCTRFGCRDQISYSLPTFNSNLLCYHSQQGWLQGLSKRTETRWTAFLLFSDVTYAFLWLKASIHNKYRWRFRQMEKYVQLELFDLRIYTSQQPTVVDSKDEQFEEIQSCVKYKQLELDLFPQPSYETCKQLVRLAA